MSIYNSFLLLSLDLDVFSIVGIVLLSIGLIIIVAGVILILRLKYKGKLLIEKSNESLLRAKESEDRAKLLLDETLKKCDNLKNDAIEEAKTIKKDAELEIKEQELKFRKDLERESKEKKAELQKMEQRLDQKEEILNKKDFSLLKKSEDLETQSKDLEKKLKEVDNQLASLEEKNAEAYKKIEEIAKLTHEEAREIVVNDIKEDAKKEAISFVKNAELQAKKDADKNAKEIISLAIQRCAVEQTNDLTVTTISIPSDDMKARLIGREGRNITAFENATGIKLIIDDTPEVVVASGFDPVRREVARIALEKLIQDGRIQPTRIEETVNKVKKDIDQTIKDAGEAATYEVGVYGVHPEIIKALGRLKFRTSYGQNVLKHSLEVAHLAGLMGQELGLDVNLCKRGGLLHDIGKSVDFENEGTHIALGVELAKKYKENRFVINCIESHHGDVEPCSIEAVIVQAADQISGSRPGARREIESNYMKRLEQLEDLANEFKGVEKSYAIQAGREIRVIVKPEQIDDTQALFLAKDIAKKIEETMEYPGQIKVNVIRESRSVEYAK